MKKNNISKSIKKSLACGCIIFSVLMLALISLKALASDMTDMVFSPDIKAGTAWLLFLFSVLLGFAGLILSSDKFSVLPRLALHFLSSFVLYFLAVVVCGGYISDGRRSLVATVLFVLIYAVFAIIYAVRNAKKAKKKEKKKEYKSQF